MRLASRGNWHFAWDWVNEVTRRRLQAYRDWGHGCTMGIDTGRCLGKRVKEHRKAMESGDCANSALAKHAWSHHHHVGWENVRVLEQQPRLYHRVTLESIHIRLHPHTEQKWWHTALSLQLIIFLLDSPTVPRMIPAKLSLFITCHLTCCHSLLNFTAILAYIKQVTFCFVPATD